MKESYIEGLASHNAPESCVCIRKDAGEALTGVRIGRVLSRENACTQSADVLVSSGRQHGGARKGKCTSDSAWSETPSMYGNSRRENREVLSLSSKRWWRDALGRSEVVANDARR